MPLPERNHGADGIAVQPNKLVGTLGGGRDSGSNPVTTAIRGFSRRPFSTTAGETASGAPAGENTESI